MVSSGLLRRVALVRTDVSEEPGASFIRVTKSLNYEQHKLQLATDVRCKEIPSWYWYFFLQRFLYSVVIIPFLLHMGLRNNLLI
jgi:hypothetical protein